MTFPRITSSRTAGDIADADIPVSSQTSNHFYKYRIGHITSHCNTTRYTEECCECLSRYQTILWLSRFGQNCCSLLHANVPPLKANSLGISKLTSFALIPAMASDGQHRKA